VKTEELIVQLTGSLERVEPLESPFMRLVRWAAVCTPVVALGILAIGARADVTSAVRQPAFVALAIMAVATAISSAASALVLSIPGAERSPALRGLPLLIAGAWTVTLTIFLVAGGAPLSRLTALPVHAACLIEIAAFAVVPGWALFTMLRRAAPLRVSWSAGLAALAATAVGAAATQIVCPIDDPAHHLVSHIVPMAILTMAVAASRRRSLIWWPAPDSRRSA
jgi:hypothetical protein